MKRKKPICKQHKSGEQIIWEYKQAKLLRNLLDAMDAYKKFHDPKPTTEAK